MSDIKQANLTGLIERCQQETGHYLRHEPYDSRYCFEIWRRAIAERDETAWETLIKQYGSFVRRWLEQRLSQFPALRFEEEALVNGVFINFYRFVGPEKFANFHNLSGILQYLKLCCATIVADAQRDLQARNLDISLETITGQSETNQGGQTLEEKISDVFDMEESVVNSADRAVFWTGVWQKLPEPSDRLLVYLRYILGMPPREIAQLYPQHFTDVTTVYRRNKNLLWRLRNNTEV
ncbi:MAG: hypothetical protein JWP00_838 [Chloroflexi bacterium]|nr:hypothetical protein [Chloroflexota bacterium]